MSRKSSVAMFLPCYNEALTIAKVVSDAKRHLPDADIYVFDNNSRDGTAEIAAKAGAIVRKEYRQGKGFAVRQAFADLDYDVIIMADGDDTYDLSVLPQAVARFEAESLDFLNIARAATVTEAYRRGHVLGNKMLTGAVSLIFGRQCGDMLSGFKIFSRRFVKSFPMAASGFEVETEIQVHAAELGIRIGEISAPYKDRPEGSVSKLSTYRDGFRILVTIIRLMQLEKPLLFFSSLAFICLCLCLLIGLPVVFTYLSSGLVPKLPSAVLAGFLFLVGAVLAGVGLTLDAVQRGRADQKKLAFLAVPRNPDVS